MNTFSQLSKLLSQQTSMAVSLEMIDIQTDRYAKDIQDLFGKIIQGLRDGSIKSKDKTKNKFVQEIEALTFKRTGLKIDLITNTHLAACMPFHPNPFSAISPAIFSERGTHLDDPNLKVFLKDQLKIIDKSLIHEGSVDTKACKVSGFFSEYVNPIYINVSKLTKVKISEQEMTSIFLHELGHCFSSYEYSNRLNTTNQVLQQSLKDALGHPKADRSYVFKELKKINPKTTDEELDKILGGENIVLGRATMRFMEEVVLSQLPQSKYDENSDETLADTFAVRWGYGAHLVSGLQKVRLSEDYDPEINRMASIRDSLASLGMISGLMIITILYIVGAKATLGYIGKTVIGSLFAGIGLAVYGLLAVFCVWFVVTVILNHGTYHRHMTYDDTRNRYRRIRNQMVEMLKSVTTFSKEQTDAVISQIKALDDLIDSRSHYKNIVTQFVDLLTPGNTTIDDSVKMQRLLEDLSANDLYIKAASFRALTQ